MKITKINDEEIEVVKLHKVRARHTIESLQAQLEAIQSQKERDNELRDAEIAEVTELLQVFEIEETPEIVQTLPMNKI